MKTTTFLLRLAIALLSASLAYPAAWDLRMVQFDASNRSRDVIIAPAANSLLGFDASKRAVNVTPGTNIAISGNQISAAGNVTNNGTLTDSYLVMGGGGGEVRPTTIQVTGGNNIVLGTINATTVAIGNITGATSDFDLLIGDAATGKFLRGQIAIGANMTRTKVGNNIVLDSTAGGGTPDDGSVTTAKFAPSALVTSSEGIASNSNNTSVPTTQAVKEYADGISAGSVPPGMATLWPTADLGSLTAGFFASGQYGTDGPDTLGNRTVVVRSLGTVADPTVDIAPGAVPAGTVVTISTTTPSAFSTITNNGTDPSYTVGTVAGNFTVSGGGTWKYAAHKAGWISSAVQSATYTIDPIPTLSSAVLQASGTDIVIGWPESVSYGAGGTGGYALTLSGGAATVTGVTGGGTNSHTLTVNRTVTNSETGTLAYTQPGDGAEDSAFQDVVTFTGFTVNTSGGPAGGGGSPLVDEGFEGTGTPSGWSGTANFDYSAAPLVGSQSARFVASTSDTATATLATAEAEVTLKFRWKTESALPAATPQFIEFLDASFNSLGSVFLSSSGTFTTDLVGYTSDAAAAGTEYYVWFYYREGASSTGALEIYFNTTDSKPARASAKYQGSNAVTKSGTVKYITLKSANFNTANVVDAFQVYDSEL